MVAANKKTFSLNQTYLILALTVLSVSAAIALIIVFGSSDTEQQATSFVEPVEESSSIKNELNLTTLNRIQTISPQEPTSTQSSVNQTVETQQPQDGLVIIGDSLLHRDGTSEQLLPKLVQNGWSDIYIDAQGCRPTNVATNGCGQVKTLLKMLEELTNNTYSVNYSSGNGPQVNQGTLSFAFSDNDLIKKAIGTKDLNSAMRSSSTIVIALGTNDDSNNSQAMEAGVRQAITSIKAINPEANIIWVTVCAQGAKVETGNAFNPILEKLSSELDFQLIDWAPRCMSDYQNDAIHYNQKGIAAYIETITTGL